MRFPPLWHHSRRLSRIPACRHTVPTLPQLPPYRLFRIQSKSFSPSSAQSPQTLCHMLSSRQILHANHLEKSLCFRRESGEPLFPHEYGDVYGQFGDQIIYFGQNLTMAFRLAPVVQMTELLHRHLAPVISQNGEPRASLRQIGGKDAEGVRPRRLPVLAHDRPRRRTSPAGWRGSGGHRSHPRPGRRTGAGWRG